MKVCSLFSGSSGNCTYIADGDISLLVDAGVSGKRVLAALAEIDVDPASINSILITHEHNDHITGAGILSRKLDIPIYATAKTWEAMSDKLGNVALKNIREIEANKDFYIGNIDITPYSIPHDAADPVAYNFMSRGKKAGVCTDLGYMPKSVLKNISDCDILLLEANHDLNMLQSGSYPYELKRRISGSKGHLSNETSGKELSKIANRVRYVMLGHLSKENNTEELALTTISSILKENGITEKDISLEVLKRDSRSNIYNIV
ncbi:MAG: MBL fold metallo-hydrolase [Clostridia bacterium]|nr:MBL fold metallo-hydrolase [Clostridia bacterium]